MKKFGKFLIMLFSVLMLCIAFETNADAQEYIVRLKTKNIPNELSEILTEVNYEHCLYTVEDGVSLEEFSEYIECIEKNKEVILIDGVNTPVLFSSDTENTDIEELRRQMIGSAYAYELMTYGNAVNVAVIDTGCNSHEDLNIAGGYNFILNNNDYSDNHGHGTHVTGIISAQHNSIGINGIAPKVNIYALKCADPYHYSDEDELIAAIYAAVDTYNCKVINMSLGVLENDALLYEAVKYAVDKGAIIIAAVGNDGKDELYKSIAYYPASYDEVIGVGSVDFNGKRSAFSQQNNSVFVVAPGETCKSTLGTSDYGEKSGTSQAAPIVTAAAAIMLSADENMMSDDFKNYIINYSDKSEDEFCGYGVINIEKMLKACIEDKIYVSPINSEGIIVFNNTDEEINAYGLLVQYEKSALSSISKNKISLLPDKNIKLSYDALTGNIKFFLWSSLKAIRPLVKARIADNPK